MNKVVWIVASFVCVSLVSACKKKIDYTLPSVTSHGANSIGFVIDDYVWVPAKKCDAWQGACNKAMAYVVPNTLEFRFTRKYRDKQSELYIKAPLDATISGPGEKIDSVGVTFYAEHASPGAGVYSQPLAGSSFKITRLDWNEKIVSGEFHFILIDQQTIPDTIHLKSGRFDFRFPACMCD
jgi:hypothetical protein